MSNRVINVDVSDSYISMTGDTAGASGAMKATTMRMTFDDHWAGTSKTVYFTDAMGEASVSVLLSADALVDGTAATYDVPIPAEAMTAEGLASVTVCGIALAADNMTVIRKITTKAAKFRVMDSEIPSSTSNEATVTATDKQQMQSALDAVVSGESGRVAAEAARVEAENARQNTETGYVAQATAQANAAAESARLAAQAVLGQIPDASLTMAKMAQDVTAALAGKVNKYDPIPSGVTSCDDLPDGIYGIYANTDNLTNIPTETFNGKIIVSLDNKYFQLAIDVVTNSVFTRSHTGTEWTGWVKIATATPPEEYDLPLASGWVHTHSYDKNSYCKTQDGMVTICYSAESNSQATVIDNYCVIATLPVGYRPSESIIGIAETYNYGGSSLYPVWVQPDGKIIVTGVGTSAPVGVGGSVTFRAEI